MFEIENYKKNLDKNLILKVINETFKKSYPKYYLKKLVKIQKNYILIGKTKINNKKKIFLIGFGKVAPYVAKNLLQIIGEKRIQKGIIISPNYNHTKSSKKIAYLKGTHPNPSKQSYDSTKKLLSFLKKIQDDDVIISIVTGGGSSCLSSPLKGISVKDEIILNKLLIRESIRADERNKIRGHFSNVKNGKLAKLVYPSKILNLIVCDDPKHIIKSVGSGATLYNNVSKENVEKILIKNNLIKKIPKNMRENLKNSLSKNNVNFKGKNIKNHVIFDNKKFLKNFKKISHSNKISKVYICPKILTEDAEKSKKFFLKYINKYKKLKNCLIIFGSELKIKVKKSNSNGGRIQHFAALCMDHLSSYFKNFLFLGFATDGHDYLKNISGVIYDNHDAKKILKYEKTFKKKLMSFNSFKIFKKKSMLLKLKSQTKNNVFDVVGIYLK